MADYVPRGLTQFGNTCWANSLLQILMACPAIPIHKPSILGVTKTARKKLESLTPHQKKTLENGIMNIFGIDSEEYFDPITYYARSPWSAYRDLFSHPDMQYTDRDHFLRTLKQFVFGLEILIILLMGGEEMTVNLGSQRSTEVALSIFLERTYVDPLDHRAMIMCSDGAISCVEDQDPIQLSNAEYGRQSVMQIRRDHDWYFAAERDDHDAEDASEHTFPSISLLLSNPEIASLDKCPVCANTGGSCCEFMQLCVAPHLIFITNACRTIGGKSEKFSTEPIRLHRKIEISYATGVIDVPTPQQNRDALKLKQTQQCLSNSWSNKAKIPGEKGYRITPIPNTKPEHTSISLKTADYKLIGFSVGGGEHGGHFRSYVEVNGKFYLCDDGHISKISAERYDERLDWGSQIAFAVYARMGPNIYEHEHKYL